MTTFGDQVFHLGGIPANSGASRFHGWWSGKAYFVDYDNGVNRDGLSPGGAFNHLATAISAASAGDVIYIRPRNAATGTDPVTITPASATNWSIPRAKYNLSLIGAGPVIGTQGQVRATTLAGHASVTGAALGDSVLTVYAPYTSIENLAFSRGGSTRAHVELYGDGTQTLNAFGSSVNNCLFRMNTSATFGAVHIVDCWECGVYNSYFDRNVQNVVVYGSTQRTEVVGCTFRGDPAAVACCVKDTGGGTHDYLLIHD